MKRILSIAGVLLLLAALAWPKLNGAFKAPSETPGRNTNDKPVPVDVFIVRGETIDDKFFTTGTLISNEEVELATETSGIIREIYLKEGETVEEGDLLVKIDDSDLQAQLNRANFRLQLAEERAGRQQTLLEKGGISQEEYDATVNEVNVFRAEVNLIDAQIADTEIRAPFSGVIGLRYVSDGSYISPTTRIATLQDIDPIKIDFSIPERYASKVKVGTPLTFEVQGVDVTLYASVYAKEPRIDRDTRTLQLRALSSNKYGVLLPGAFADLTLTLDRIKDALMVPTTAVVPEIQGQKVFLLKNGMVQPSSVTTGIRTPTSIQILSGVEKGDTVLTTGLLQVRPGMKVVIDEVVN